MGSSHPQNQKIKQNIAKIQPQFFESQIKNMKFDQRNDKFKQKSDQTKKQLSMALQLLKKKQTPNNFLIQSKLLLTQKLHFSPTKKRASYFPAIKEKILHKRVIKRQSKSHNQKSESMINSKEMSILNLEDQTEQKTKQQNQILQEGNQNKKNKKSVLEPILIQKSSNEIKQKPNKIHNKKFTKSQKFLPGEFAYNGLSVVYAKFQKPKKLHTQLQIAQFD